MASEVAPFAKTGGLADVASALPKALAERGHEVRTVMPSYDVVRQNGYQPREAEPGLIGFDLGRRGVTADIQELDDGGIPVSLVDVPGLYRRGTIYTEDADEAFRFGVLCRAALELCRRWRWSPDVIHCHDWQTALVPIYLHTVFGDDPLLGDAGTVLTIHNLAYQGTFPAEVAADLGLEAWRHLLHEGHLADGWLGMLETGLMHADVISTVSPGYAREIMTPEYGFGLEALLRSRSRDLVGILNGIDTRTWNPAFDRYLPYRYSAKSLWRKEWNTVRLLQALQLEHVEGVPVLGIVSRLVEQKGIDLLPGPLSDALEADRIRLVALGSGEPALEASLRRLEERFPGRARFVPGHDEALAHRIEGSVDVFLMPSRFEPSGLNQMYSLAYGTPPLVRRTGGLADTVEHWNPAEGTGTGFVFEHADSDGVRWALEEALSARADRKGWKRLQLNGMGVDNSWSRSAAEYERLYRSLADRDRSRRVASRPT